MLNFYFYFYFQILNFWILKNIIGVDCHKEHL